MSDWRMQYEIAANEEIARFRQASDVADDNYLDRSTTTILTG